MPAPATGALQAIRQYLGEERLAGWSDSQLLDRYQSGAEDAFAVLLRRHGPMVLAVCQRILGQEQDAEDAFQATFLVLARRARVALDRASLGGWLYAVAWRIASKARTARNRRVRHERVAALAPQTCRATPDLGFEEELARLPEPLRTPLILCYLKGHTHEEAAHQLGILPRTFKARLQKARERLRLRLSDQHTPGLPTVSPSLAAAVLRQTTQMSTGQTACVSPAVLALAATPSLGRWASLAAVLLAVTLFTLTLTALPAPVAPPPARSVTPALAAGDPFGDPLPNGARARLGTLRLRHGDRINSVALSADGTLLATGGADGCVRLHDVATGKTVRVLDHPTIVYAVAFSPDGKLVASASSNQSVQVWDVHTGEKRYQFTRPRSICLGLAFSPDSTCLAGSGTSAVHLWNLADNQTRFEWAGKHSVYGPLTFTSDGTRLLTPGDGQQPCLYDVAKGQLHLRLPELEKGVRSVSITRDGKLLAVGLNDGRIRLWDPATGKNTRTLGKPRTHSAVAALTFSSDGKTLYSTGQSDQAVRIWDMATGTQTGELPIETYDGASVALSANNKVLAVAGGNHVVRIWRADPASKSGWKEFQPTNQAHQSLIQVLAFAPDGKTLATGSWFDRGRLWDVATGRQVGLLGDQTFALAFRPDGKELVNAQRDFTLRRRDPRTGSETATSPWRVTGHPVTVGYLDQTRYGACFIGNKVHLLELGDKVQSRILGTHTKTGTRLAFSADGRWLASVSEDRTARIWNVRSGELVREIAGLRSIWSLCFSPDGRLLAIGDDESTITVIAVASGKSVANLKGHQNVARALAFSPDGRWLASGSIDRTIRLWEVESWSAADIFNGHAGSVSAVGFAPDGRLLASGSYDTTVLLWDLAPDPGVFSAERLETAWTDLADADATKARRAMWSLARSPGEAVRFLAKKMVPPEPERVRRLIANLDDDTFRVRETASEELKALGESVAPTLRAALAKAPLEAKHRMERILVAFGTPDDRLVRLRLVRAVAALEYAGTPAARKLLRSVAAAKDIPWLAEEARKALGR